MLRGSAVIVWGNMDSYNNWSEDRWVQQVIDQGVAFLSLGESGHYFMRSRAGCRAWCLPADADRYVSNMEQRGDKVRSLWLGRDDAWVAQTEGNTRRHSLKGNYGSLDNVIEYNTTEIAALAMNLEHDRNYFVLFRDGTRQGNPVGAPLTMARFDAWIQRLRYALAL
jgi:hypothetical protein